MQLTVDIGDMKFSTSPGDRLVTYALGSCVGLTLYDPQMRIGGMVHSQLPLAKANPQKAERRPCMFTDTGVGLLLQTLFDHGAARERIVAKVAGASNIMDGNGVFKIGERNFTVLRKILWKNNILIQAQDVGGTASRSMYLHLDSGRTLIKSAGVEKEL